MNNSQLLKLILIFLSIGSILQFVFEFIFPISYLPIYVPGLSIILELGNFSLYIIFISIILFSLLQRKIKALIPLATLLLIATAISALKSNYSLSPLWYSLEVILAIFGISAAIESQVKSSLVNLLNLPTLFLVLFVTITSLYIDIIHIEILTDYLLLTALSVISFGLYTISWRANEVKKAIVSFLLSIPALFIFLPLYFIVSNNRFMEIIMNMVIPSAFGIVFSSPYYLQPFLLILSLAMFFIVALAIKRNAISALGYFIIISSVFKGISGYGLLIYMVEPLFGIVLMNWSTEEKHILELIRTLVQRQRFNKQFK
ncbi:MAG: cytochrome b558/566 subunit B [Saccharolobus sp.]|uniref:cytochrome b558/566 subunit B n=1 Tax=Saccharolobus sp. TaxID=2100761 RepID=UPI0031698399